MGREHKLKKYNFVLTTLQKKKLEQYSKLSGLSLSDIVRRAIDDYLERMMPIGRCSGIELPYVSDN